MATGTAEPLGKDVFLRLLTTQLRHQDPLEPMDGMQFVTQLAQFTQLEQATSMNDRLDALVKVNTALNNYGAAGLIGKTVKVLGGALKLQETGGSELSYRLAGEAQEVIVQVSDKEGNVVRSIRPGPQPAGLQTVHWDGRDQDGNVLPAGEYLFSIAARDTIGGPVKSEQISSGVVTGVLYEGGVPYLLVNGGKVPAAELVSVSN